MRPRTRNLCALRNCHPAKTALVGLLRMQGPLTATQAGVLLGESSGSTSFHLRSLAKYGLVEEAPGGQGRERPWRATTMFTQWGDDEAGRPAGAAADLLSAVVAQNYFDDVRRWLAARADEPVAWRAAAHFGDTELWLTADELSALGDEMRAQMGVLAGLEWLPSLLFGMHAGVWADRIGHRRQLMIAADLGRAALLASIPVCYAAGVLTLAQLFAVAFATGTLSILFVVCDPALFVALVPAGKYVDGNSLIYGSRALSFVVCCSARARSAACWARPRPGGSPGAWASAGPTPWAVPCSPRLWSSSRWPPGHGR